MIGLAQCDILGHIYGVKFSFGDKHHSILTTTDKPTILFLPNSKLLHNLINVTSIYQRVKEMLEESFVCVYAKIISIKCLLIYISTFDSSSCKIIY